jgi:hypothetical protein
MNRARSVRGLASCARAGERGHVRCGPFERRLLSTSVRESRLPASFGLFAAVPPPTSKCLRAAGGLSLTRPIAISRREKTVPRMPVIPGTHTQIVGSLHHESHP